MTFFTTRPPALNVSPRPDTALTPRKWSRAAPALIRRGPERLAASAPPIVPAPEALPAVLEQLRLPITARRCRPSAAGAAPQRAFLKAGVVAILVVAGFAAWFGARADDPSAAQRERTCKAWGISGKSVLAKCRESPEQEHAAIEPLERAAVEREIGWFNRDLSALAAGKPRANVNDYPSRSIEDAYKAAGGMLGFIVGPVDGATFPAKGLPAKVIGVITTNEPDSDDSPDERQSEPRYFTLESEMLPLPPSEKLDDRAIKELTDRPVVNLDIESLNRHERQFIIDHCHPLWATPCRATVFGHFDEIAGRRSAELKYVGIVADQVDIEPLTWNTARPDWDVSTRSLMAR